MVRKVCSVGNTAVYGKEWEYGNTRASHRYDVEPKMPDTGTGLVILLLQSTRAGRS